MSRFEFFFFCFIFVDYSLQSQAVATPPVMTTPSSMHDLGVVAVYYPNPTTTAVTSLAPPASQVPPSQAFSVTATDTGATSPGRATPRCPTRPGTYHHAASKALLITPRASPTESNHPSPAYQPQHPTPRRHAAQVPTPHHSAP
jgi:hypothetical protein